MEFRAFTKIPRLYRACTITEKIDGTNACVVVSDDKEIVLAQSRKRTLHLGKNSDNYGFAAWVEENREMLKRLGPGYHFGEWWGAGIQRRYGLDEKRFSLFNTGRWNEDNTPDCVSVVPVVAEGVIPGTPDFDLAIERLRDGGSLAAPGFNNPEGVVIYHTAADQYYKYTFDGDGHKGAR